MMDLHDVSHAGFFEVITSRFFGFFKKTEVITSILGFFRFFCPGSRFLTALGSTAQHRAAGMKQIG